MRYGLNPRGGRGQVLCMREGVCSVKSYGSQLCTMVRWLTLLVVIGLVGALSVAHEAEAAGCSNAMVRIAQYATFLPDCRAFELVSPPEVTPELEAGEHLSVGVRASIGGGGISWFSYAPLSGSLGGEFYDLSIREPSGWTTEPVGPRISPRTNAESFCRPGIYFSANLSQSILMDGSHSPGLEQNSEIGECGSNDPPLVSGEPEGFQNVFIRDNATGAYTLANITPPSVTPADAQFQGASEDLSHVVFEDDAKLTAAAPVGASLYEWAAGSVHLVTVLPSGTPSVGSLPDAVGGGRFKGESPISHPMSADGSRVVFEAAGKLYLRENVEREDSSLGPEGECLESTKACTVQLDASQATSKGPGGGGVFLAANLADTKIYFTDESEARLTDDTAENSGQHLYEYDTETRQLSDLTHEGGLELQGLTGISSNGSYLYLVASAALVPEATAEQPNLYVFHAGTPTFITTLAAGRPTSEDWTPSNLTARVSSDGRYVAFDSIERLSGYEEIYLYDAFEGTSPTCVSCAPGGARPTAPAELPPAERSSEGQAPVYLQRSLLDDGRIFFDTANTLLPGAVNGLSNVYEYEAGQVSLISTGTSEANSFYFDASPSGDDVFFVTTQHLVSGDVGNGMGIYDARVDGGLPEPEAPPVPCSGEDCRGVPLGSALLPTLATIGQQASGNLLPPAASHTVTRLTRAQKLKRALHACLRDRRPRKRAACRRQAHARYGGGK